LQDSQAVVQHTQWTITSQYPPSRLSCSTVQAIHIEAIDTLLSSQESLQARLRHAEAQREHALQRATAADAVQAAADAHSAALAAALAGFHQQLAALHSFVRGHVGALKEAPAASGRRAPEPLHPAHQLFSDCDHAAASRPDVRGTTVSSLRHASISSPGSQGGRQATEAAVAAAAAAGAASSGACAQVQRIQAALEDLRSALEGAAVAGQQRHLSTHTAGSSSASRWPDGVDPDEAQQHQGAVGSDPDGEGASGQTHLPHDTHSLRAALRGGGRDRSGGPVNVREVQLRHAYQSMLQQMAARHQAELHAAELKHREVRACRLGGWMAG